MSHCTLNSSHQVITRGQRRIRCIGTAVEATMFAPPVAKPKKAAAPSKNTSPLHRAAPFGHRHNDVGTPSIVHQVRRSQEQSFNAATPASFDRACAPTVSWNF